MLEPAPAQKLDSLSNSAAGMGEANSFMNPEKKKRGRPKGSTKASGAGGGMGAAPGADSGQGWRESLGPDPKADLELTKKTIKPVFEMLSGVAVRITDEQGAAFKPEELEVVVDSGAQCIQQYLPAFLSQHTALIIFTATMTNWGLRVYMLREMKLEEIRARERAARPVDAEVVSH